MIILQRLISALFTVACVAFATQAIMPLNILGALQSSANQPTRTATLKFLNKSKTYAPLKFDSSNDVIILPVIVNGMDTWAILDTEAGATVVDIELAKQTGVEKTGRKFTVKAGASEEKVDVYNGIDLKVPGQFQINAELPALDLSSLSRKLEKNIGVIIGFNIIKELSIFINTKNNFIQFRGSGNIYFGERPHYNIEIENGIINGNINDKKAKFRIDTGANGKLTIAKKDWSNYIPKNAILKTVQSTNIFGKNSLKIYAEDVSISLGPKITTRNIRTTRSTITNQKINAYIGYGFLKGRIVILDYSKGRLSILKED